MQFTEIDETEESEEERAQLIAMRSAAASRSTWISVAVNLVLTTAQILVGVFARSQALIADGIHSLSDLVAAAQAVAGIRERTDREAPTVIT